MPAANQNKATPNDAKAAQEHDSLKEQPTEKEDTPDNDEQTYIVYKEPIMEPNGVQSFKEHRVKTEDWAKYEKDNNL